MMMPGFSGTTATPFRLEEAFWPKAAPGSAIVIDFLFSVALLRLLLRCPLTLDSAVDWSAPEFWDFGHFESLSDILVAVSFTAPGVQTHVPDDTLLLYS